MIRNITPRIILSVYVVGVAYYWFRSQGWVTKKLEEGKLGEVWWEFVHLLAALLWPFDLLLRLVQAARRTWALVRILGSMWLLYFRLKWRFGFRTKVKFLVIDVKPKN